MTTSSFPVLPGSLLSSLSAPLPPPQLIPHTIAAHPSAHPHAHKNSTKNSIILSRIRFSRQFTENSHQPFSCLPGRRRRCGQTHIPANCSGRHTSAQIMLREPLQYLFIRQFVIGQPAYVFLSVHTSTPNIRSRIGRATAHAVPMSCPGKVSSKKCSIFFMLVLSGLLCRGLILAFLFFTFPVYCRKKPRRGFLKLLHPALLLFLRQDRSVYPDNGVGKMIGVLQPVFILTHSITSMIILCLHACICCLQVRICNGAAGNRTRVLPSIAGRSFRWATTPKPRRACLLIYRLDFNRKPHLWIEIESIFVFLYISGCDILYHIGHVI